ncbi:MAG: cystathionine beta-lyase, partial [Pedococcus sp.]
MNALAARRRHPAAIALLLLLGLILTGVAYSTFA